MIVYSLDLLLSQFGTSSLFHIQFYQLLLDLHTGFSGGRQGGLVFPSLETFSSVYCDLYSQRLWHSQYSRSRCFSGTLLLVLFYFIFFSWICIYLQHRNLQKWNFLMYLLLIISLKTTKFLGIYFIIYIQTSTLKTTENY